MSGTAYVNIPVKASASLMRKTRVGYEPGWADSGCPLIGPPHGRKMVHVRFMVDAVIDEFTLRYGHSELPMLIDAVKQMGVELGKQIELAMHPVDAASAFAGVHDIYGANP